VQVRPAAGLMPNAKPTTPPKPLRAVIVIVELPATVALTVNVVGLAERVKSWT